MEQLKKFTMQRVLIIGNSPLPNDAAKRRPSEGLRTWQFLRSFVEYKNAEYKDVAAKDANSGDEGRDANLGGAGFGNRAFGNRALRVKEGFNIRLVTIAMEECFEEEENFETNFGENFKASFGVSSVSGKNVVGGNAVHGNPLRKDIRHSDYFIQHQIPSNERDLQRTLQAISDEFVPDLVIGVGLEPAFYASRLKINCPFWADLNEWAMAKAQVESYKTDSDREIGNYLKMEESILSWADTVSVVSEASRYAVIGELAMMQKLGKESFGLDKVVVIESGLEDFESDKIEKIVRTVRKPPDVSNVWSAGGFEQVTEEGIRYFRGMDSFSGADLPHNSFVVLWLGSYSSWVDEETLFKGVEAAIEEIEMAEGGYAKNDRNIENRNIEKGDDRNLEGRDVDGNVNAMGNFEEKSRFEHSGGVGSGYSSSTLSKNRRTIYFVSTGGLSKGELENKIYLKFKEMVSLSRFKDHFVFLGWVPVKHIPYLYEEADCGINVDRKCLQTSTGSHNRLLEMMKFSLPVITTLGTELSYQIQSFGAGTGVRIGSAEAVRDAILELFHNPARRKDLSLKGRKFVEQYCPYERVMRPFEKFLEEFKSGKLFYGGDLPKFEKGFERVQKNLAKGGSSAIKTAINFFKNKQFK